jgi:hypothetical protein
MTEPAEFIWSPNPFLHLPQDHPDRIAECERRFGPGARPGDGKTYSFSVPRIPNVIQFFPYVPPKGTT